ncbi:MAG: hypothetical protein ACI90V_004121, partial [Bacillariaceae sp.]
KIILDMKKRKVYVIERTNGQIESIDFGSFVWCLTRKVV